MAQNIVQGTVSDGETGEILIGVSISVLGTIKGTITDLDGNFSLTHNEPIPYSVKFSFIGYEDKEIEIAESDAKLNVKLETKSIIASEIVVSASRVEENIMQSPVTIEKIGYREIQATAAPDFYDEINNMKGVVRTQASLTFNTINTRGFATAGNTRFVQLQDGIDNAAPLLNFPTGNVVGISELDIKNIELVPGAASALYGPNAFNGILFMNSKEPWNYQGLSAQLKGGFTQGEETNALQGFSLRYADAINNKFAYKINVSTFLATDWTANDYTTHAPTYDNSVNPNAPNFSGVNIYGDEFTVPIGTGITRTGWREGDLLDNSDAKSIKIDGAIHYRLNDNIEANVSYKYGTGSSVYQGAERYALRNFVQQFAKAELNGDNWNLRAYGSFTDAGDSYNMTALGTIINEALFPTIKNSTYQFNTPNGAIPIPVSAGWAVAAGIAASGALVSLNPNLTPGNLAASKLFADAGGFTTIPAALWPQLAPLVGQSLYGSRLPAGTPASVFSDLGLLVIQGSAGTPRPEVGSPLYNQLLEGVRSGLFQQGGAGFIDNSAMYHFEGNYDFSEKLNDVIGLQIGGNTRRYSLFTDGTVFREFNPETGQNERITIDEWGAYIQASKLLFSEALKLTGSLRYDKNENFKGQISPRLSAVYSIGEQKKHNFRTSYQTGFRNPSTQGQFIFFPATQVLLGGTKANADIVNEIDNTVFNIYEDGALALDGETMVNLDYVKPERLTSFEIGYKAIYGSDFFIDVNFYQNNYKDFISQLTVLSTQDLVYLGNTYPAGGAWFPYTNVPIDFASNGIDLGLQYKLNRKWSVNGNYSYASLDFDEEALIGTPFQGSNFDPGFNTPENKFTLGFQGRNIVKNFGVAAAFRTQDEFFYQSSFGEGTIPAYSTLDASINYKVPSMKTTFKLGATNLFQEDYVTNVGNPTIGRTVVLTITYDQFSN
jgi:outer membrane receptor protein involved in Fe transport